MPSYEFMTNNSQALLEPNVVLRDSLGTLAVAILSKRMDVSTAKSEDLLLELHEIIKDLQNSYQLLNL